MNLHQPWEEVMQELESLDESECDDDEHESNTVEGAQDQWGFPGHQVCKQERI